jgi:hypothetical protein
MSVLQKLKHINAEGTVLLKGRSACEIDTTDELLSTGKGYVTLELVGVVCCASPFLIRLLTC